MAKSLDFETAFDKLTAPVKGASGAESQIDLNGDLSIGGSKVIIGVDVAGGRELFDCLDDLA